MANDDEFGKDPLVYSEQVKEQMAKNPEIAEAMRDFAAQMRQAHHAWKTGQYASFDDAMEAITGQRPELLDPDDADYDAATAALKRSRKRRRQRS